MRFLSLLLFFAACSSSAAERQIELRASGISVPFFDTAGKLTHRLEAKRGTKAGALQQLHEVELVYFSATQPNVIVQKLIAADATWDEQKELLVGRGAVTVATEENRLTGEGFDFALPTSMLHIHRAFKMENSELVLTSDRATVELLVKRAGDQVKVTDVKRCEATGNLHIVVQRTARRSYQFDEAFSEIAVYESATQLVTFPRAVRYFKAGRPAGGSDTTEIFVGPKQAKP